MIRIQSFSTAVSQKGGRKKDPRSKNTNAKNTVFWKPKVMEVDGSDDFCFERLGDFKVKPAVNFQECIGAFKDFLEFSPGNSGEMIQFDSSTIELTDFFFPTALTSWKSLIPKQNREVLIGVHHKHLVTWETHPKSWQKMSVGDAGFLQIFWGRFKWLWQTPLIGLGELASACGIIYLHLPNK